MNALSDSYARFFGRCSFVAIVNVWVHDEEESVLHSNKQANRQRNDPIIQ